MDARTMLVYVRDVAFTAAGIVGIWHQEFVGPVKVPLLILYASVLQVPAVAHLLALRFGTASSSSASVSAPAQPVSSSPSSEAPSG